MAEFIDRIGGQSQNFNVVYYKYITYAGDESNGHLIVTSDDALIFIKAAFPELYKEAFDRARAEYEARMKKEADDDDTV